MRKILLALALFSTAPAFAEPKDDASPPPGAAEEWHPHYHFSAAIGPAWVHVLRKNYQPAFTNNGFNTPGNDRVGFDFLGYFTTESRWQLGLALTSFSFEQDVGAWSASYGDSMVGVYVAKQFLIDPTCDITLGTVFGWNNAGVTVFSANQNGRLRENSALIAPTIGYAHRLSPMAKLGLRGSYFVPFGESTQLSGQDLGVSKIGARGFLLALELVLGRI